MHASLLSFEFVFLSLHNTLGRIYSSGFFCQTNIYCDALLFNIMQSVELFLITSEKLVSYVQQSNYAFATTVLIFNTYEVIHLSV